MCYRCPCSFTSWSKPVRNAENLSVTPIDFDFRHAAYVIGRKGPGNLPRGIKELCQERLLTLNLLLTVFRAPHGDCDVDSARGIRNELLGRRILGRLDTLLAATDAQYNEKQKG
jgi:hypothetical protein